VLRPPRHTNSSHAQVGHVLAGLSLGKWPSRPLSHRKQSAVRRGGLAFTPSFAILGLRHQPGSESVPDVAAFKPPQGNRTAPDIFGAAVAAC